MKALTQKVNDTSGITPLIVIPGNKLDKVVIEGDTGLGIKDGGVSVTVQVAGDKVVLGVCQNTCVWSVSVR
jgi:hypothetical protein